LRPGQQAGSGQIAKQMAQIAQIVDRQIGQFSANTITNPKEHCNKITTKGDVVKSRVAKELS